MRYQHIMINYNHFLIVKNFLETSMNDKIKNLKIDFDIRENLDNVIDFDVAKNVANNIRFIDIAKYIANKTN